MIKKMMIAGLLIWGGSLWAVAQTRMTIAQLFERIEENSKSLRTSKSGVEAASIGIESAKSKKLPDLDASLSFSYIGNALMTDRDFSNAQGLKSPHFGNNFAFQAQQVVYAGGAINAGIRLAELGKHALIIYSSHAIIIAGISCFFLETTPGSSTVPLAESLASSVFSSRWKALVSIGRAPVPS